MRLPALPLRVFAVSLTVGFVLGCLEPLIKVPIDDRSDAGLLDGGAGGGDGGQ
jgi:hypothetical protein